MAGMAGNGMDMTGNVWNGWKWLDGWKWLEMAGMIGNGWKWLGYVVKWMEVAENAW